MATSVAVGGVNAGGVMEDASSARVYGPANDVNRLYGSALPTDSGGGGAVANERVYRDIILGTRAVLSEDNMFVAIRGA